MKPGRVDWVLWNVAGEGGLGWGRVRSGWGIVSRGSRKACRGREEKEFRKRLQNLKRLVVPLTPDPPRTLALRCSAVVSSCLGPSLPPEGAFPGALVRVSASSPV